LPRYTEGLPNLDTGFSGLPALQSLLPHCYSTERFHAASSPFTSRLLRLRWIHSNASRLNILPHCS
jgi:hypothetical protein